MCRSVGVGQILNLSNVWARAKGIQYSSITLKVAESCELHSFEMSRSDYPMMQHQITFHWIKGHTGLKGNERADYLAKTVASYNPNITYGAIPVFRGKQLLEDYYTQIWDAAYINSGKASHTKPLIPSIFHRKSLSLWPNHILIQLLTNHGCFCSYLHKMKKAPTPLCSCPEKIEQTARHLMTECSLFSKDRPAVLQTSPFLW